MRTLIALIQSHRGAALSLAALGLIVRLGLAAWFGLNTPPEPGSDEKEYDTYAWNVAQGHGYRGMSPDVADQNHLTAYRAPGPSLVWAGIYVVFGHRYWAIRIANCLFGAISVYLVYEIGRLCYSARVGLISAAVYSVMPTALIYTIGLLSEPLGTFWFLAFILASLWFAERPTWGRASIAGLLLGCSMLTRPNSVFMLPLLGVWCLWQFRWDWRNILKAAAIPIVAVGTLAPWTIRNYMVFREFIPLSTLGGSALLQGNNDVVVSDPRYFGYCVWDTTIPEYKPILSSAGDEVERDRRAKNLAIEWLKNNPDKWWFLVRAKFVRSLTPFLQPTTLRLYRVAMLLSWGPVLAVCGLAFFPTLISFLRHRHAGWLLHLAILHYLLVSIIFYALSRYRHPVEPLCVILAVGGIAMLANAINVHHQRRSDLPVPK